MVKFNSDQIGGTMSELNLHQTLDPQTRQFVQDISALGGQVWIVGGAVRDWFLGIAPHDFDLEVSGVSQSELQSLPGWKVQEAGDRFGVWLVGSPAFEVALPQVRIRTGNGHQDEIAIIDHNTPIDKSLARRDFTVNAMAVNASTGELVDPFNGKADLNSRILRAIDPDNFGADPLRVLRGMQFASRFNMSASIETIESALVWFDGFSTLSPDRVRSEWVKWSHGASPAAGIRFLIDTGWIAHFPELNSLINLAQDAIWHPEGDAMTHTLMVLDNVDTNDPIVVWAALLHDIGKVQTTTQEDGRIRSHGHAGAGADMVPGFFASIGITGHNVVNVQAVQALVKDHMWIPNLQSRPSMSALNRRSVAVAPASLAQLVAVSRADVSGRGQVADTSMHDLVLDMANQMDIVHNQPSQILMGRHLINMGMAPGVQMGAVLADAFQAQLDGAFSDLAGAISWAADRIN